MGFHLLWCANIQQGDGQENLHTCCCVCAAAHLCVDVAVACLSVPAELGM